MAKKSSKTSNKKKPYPGLIDRRFDQIRLNMEEHKVDALVVTYLPNIHYLTNYSGSAATLFILPGETHFITDDRYEEQIKQELYNLPNLKTHITRDVWGLVNKTKMLKDIEVLGFEADRMPYAQAVDIRNQIRPVKFKPAPQVVEPYTMPKAPEELENIKKACKMAEQVYEKMLDIIKPGITEKEIATEIAYQGRLLGSEGDPFDIIVTSGQRGALVHGTPSDKKIRKNDIILMDFGCIANGFGSDISRTVAVGKATKEQQKVYKLLREAEMKAINDVRPGMKGATLDGISRDMIKDAGYGDNFKHSLGHGIGLVAHEMPIITFRKDDQIIPEECVLAIEPGIYIADKFGMRVEDNILVTRNGGEQLTDAPDEIPVI